MARPHRGDDVFAVSVDFEGDSEGALSSREQRRRDLREIQAAVVLHGCAHLPVSG